MEKIILIGDNEVRRVPVQESHEELVSLFQELPDMLFDLTAHKKHHFFHFVRKGVALRLAEAQQRLPDGLQLQIEEGYRPLSLQQSFWDEIFAFLSQKHPHFSTARLEMEAMKFVAPIDVAPHVTGSAIDLTIIDSDGNPLDMGMEFNGITNYDLDVTKLHSPHISQEAYENRMILHKAMTGAGFINYPFEWWHYSYGDKYWAYMTGTRHAIYGPIGM